LTAFCHKRELKLWERIFGDYFTLDYIKNYSALRFVNRDYLSPEKYKEVCSAAIAYSRESLPFVDEDSL
jgi:hypothetical protein